MTQAERLQQSAGALRRIFLEMDSGMISMETFRAKMRALHLVETHVTSRLLRDPPVSYTALLKSLAMPNDGPLPSHPAGHVGPMKPLNVYYTEADASQATKLRETFGGASQRVGPARVRDWSVTAHASAGGDVIAWRAPPRNTAVLDTTRNNCDGPPAAGSFAIPDGGRGNKAGIGRREQSDIVATIMQEENTDMDRMETHNTRQFRAGLGMRENPRPHSQHGEAHVMLRETIYSAIRELGAGRQTSVAFRHRLETLGVRMPRAAEVELKAYERSGRLKFNVFVRAFDEFFRSLQPEPTRQPTVVTSMTAAGVASSKPQTIEEMEAQALGPEKKVRPFHPAAIPGAEIHHGDIITWQYGGTAPPEREDLSVPHPTFYKQVCPPPPPPPPDPPTPFLAAARPHFAHFLCI